MTIRPAGWQRHTLAVAAMSFSAMLFLWTAGTMRGPETVTIHEATRTVRFASALEFAPDRISSPITTSSGLDSSAEFAGQSVVSPSTGVRGPMSVSISEDGRSATIKARGVAPSKAVEYAEILTTRLVDRAKQMATDASPLMVVPTTDQNLQTARNAILVIAMLGLMLAVVAAAGLTTRTATGRRAASAFLHLLVR